MYSGWQQWAYVAACVVVPGAWGATVAWLFSRRDRKASKGDGSGRPAVDYMI